MSRLLPLVYHLAFWLLKVCCSNFVATDETVLNHVPHTVHILIPAELRPLVTAHVETVSPLLVREAAFPFLGPGVRHLPVIQRARLVHEHFPRLHCVCGEPFGPRDLGACAPSRKHRGHPQVIQPARGSAAGCEARSFLAKLLPSCAPGQRQSRELPFRGIEVSHNHHGTLALTSVVL